MSTEPDAVRDVLVVGRGEAQACTVRATRTAAAGARRRLYYPIEMVRALVGVWLFAGCRIDEIRRLDIDCTER
ncbi:hypothetical protein SK571_45775, partial [Lentzea sp. BCCO 10_0798]